MSTRLENTATTGATNIALAQGYNSSFTGLANPESENFSDSTTANSLYSIDGSTENTISGNSQEYRFPRYNNLNTASRAEGSTGINMNTYSYGNYYTWNAAIADTSHISNNNTSITTTSICPAGWRLPKGGNKSNEANNDFWLLITDGLNGGTKPANYDSNTNPFYTGTPEGSEVSSKLRRYPNNYVYSGDISYAQIEFRRYVGVYWTSTVNNYRYAYFLNFGVTGVYPGVSNQAKTKGRSIRCTAIGS